MPSCNATTLLTTFQNKPQVRPGFRIYFDFIFNVSTDPALMEAIAPDPTVGLVRLHLTGFFGISYINHIRYGYISNMAYQGFHGDWKTLKMKMVMEKSWNMKNWPKVMKC